MSASSLPGYSCVFWMREKAYHKAHLHFIITCPEDADGWALIVGATSRKPEDTSEFVLHSGDHPALKSDSILSFASVQLANMEKLARSYRDIPKLVWSERKAEASLIARIQHELLGSGVLEPRHELLIAKAQNRPTGQEHSAAY